jgi:transposase-like protein
MKKKAGEYTEEFKETAVKLALAGDKSIAAVARELGMKERNLYDWIKSWKKRNNKAGSKSETGRFEDVGKLQKRIRELELENEILKKASAYFAKTLL